MLFSVLKDLFRSFRVPVEQDVLPVARQLLDESRYENAIKVLDILLEARPKCVDALILRGAAKRAAGRANEAVADLESAAALAPDNPRGVYELALASYATGNSQRAFELCQRARQIDPDFTAPRWLQAQITLGGEDYVDVLRRIHGQLKPRTYVEIGVFQGSSLKLATAPTVAIGIDPEPQLTFSLAPHQRVFAEPSDTFFATRDLVNELGGSPVDLAFIDGMHHFEFALRDFANIERCCTPQSTILIHDCYPLDRETASRDGKPPFWSGDIWRLTVLLRKHRPDLSIHTVGAPPTGLGVVRNLDPQSRVLADHHDALCRELLALDYSYLDDDKSGKLNLVANEWPRVRALLA